ncbi:uncharacterized protein LOC112216680 isoform X3 [Oncorhynchus tshawytscha]|uniref:uncharacterized protein LOC112216680 isoform X3 n=1 Tax=Oncorhynchus tshawytscha TaxID=74940 RepID=UPI000D09CE19|nr:uncharacterized protein LOC112216680 isoform X3 [Oncorhynchus tshawytscha]
MSWRGCILRWARDDVICIATRGNRIPLNTQQRCGFKKVVKGVIEETGPSHTEPSEGLIHKRGASPPWSPPLGVQSYFDKVRADWLETLRPQEHGDLRKWGSIAANAVVFCCWSAIPPALYDQILHIQPCLQNPVFPHAPVHVQPLLLLPHGGQHVRPLELLLQHRLHARQGAVHGRLHVCRYQRTCERL